MAFLRQMFKKSFYQKLIHETKIYQGGNVADPFIIAKAACIENSSVVTTEGFYKNGIMKENAPKIPYICSKLNVNCLSPIGFMEKANWLF